MSSTKLAFCCFLFLLAVALTAQNDTPVLALANPATETAPLHSLAPTAEVFTAAAFPGGHAALLRQLGPTITYPELAKDYAIEGTVVVRLTLDDTGLVQASKVVRGLGFGCDEAAVEALTTLPRWQPAQLGGRAVASVVYVPLRFSLQ